MKELPCVVFIMRRKMSNLCVVSYIYIISSTALFLIKSIPSLPTLIVLNTSIFQFAHKHSNSSDKNQLNYSVVVFDIFCLLKRQYIQVPYVLCYDFFYPQTSKKNFYKSPNCYWSISIDCFHSNQWQVRSKLFQVFVRRQCEAKSMDCGQEIY